MQNTPRRKSNNRGSGAWTDGEKRKYQENRRRKKFEIY